MPGRRARQNRLEPLLDRLFAYAVSLTHDRERSHDLVQDCAVRVLQAKRVPRDEAAYRAWLFKTLRNLYIDEKRKSQPLPRGAGADLEQPLDSWLVWRSSESLVNGLTVRFAMAKLPWEKREVMVLVDVVGFTYAETAIVLDLPVGTVMSRLSRARAALLDALEGSNLRTLPRRQGNTG